MRNIKDALIVGVAVHCRHEASPNAECVHHHLRRGGEAVRGAAGVRDDVMLQRIIAIVIDAENDRHVLVLCWRANDHLLCAGGTMRHSLRCIREDASGFNNDVHAHRSPWKLGGILCGEDLDPFPVDDKFVTLGNHRAWECAVGRVVLEEERVHLRIHKVVDRHHLNLRGALKDRLQALAPDATESVDPYANRHLCLTCFSALFAATASPQAGLPSRLTTTG